MKASDSLSRNHSYEKIRVVTIAFIPPAEPFDKDR